MLYSNLLCHNEISQIHIYFLYKLKPCTIFQWTFNKNLYIFLLHFSSGKDSAIQNVVQFSKNKNKLMVPFGKIDREQK